ncbi:MAG: hypothetical protein EBU70_14365 [Actinobacteria bacterium]|nr:hypothetical protein [Actinomycetota bacterium]
MLIKADDLNPSLNAGAVYVAECQYVHPEDAQNNNDDNNASYRVFTVGSTVSSGTYPWTMSGTTQRQKPAIMHMATVYPTTAVVNNADGPDGRFVVATNVINNNNGTYRYEYAVFNLNSNASGASFSVPVPAGVTITNAGFKDIAYHSGEVYDGTDWTFSNSGGVAKWQCTQTFAQNPNANALRFSTLYNFWFDAAAPGTNGDATIGLFKQAGSVTAAVKVPSAPCAQGDLNCNGIVDGADLGIMLANWGGSGSSDLDGNGQVDGGDLGILLSRWGPTV